MAVHCCVEHDCALLCISVWRCGCALLCIFVWQCGSMMVQWLWELYGSNCSIYSSKICGEFLTIGEFEEIWVITVKPYSLTSHHLTFACSWYIFKVQHPTAVHPIPLPLSACNAWHSPLICRYQVLHSPHSPHTAHTAHTAHISSAVKSLYLCPLYPHQLYNYCIWLCRFSSASYLVLSP